MKILIIFLFLVGNSTFASTVSISLKQNSSEKKPPSDLIYKQKKINAYEAFEMQVNGFDLSKLNPHESNLWKDRKFPINQVTIPNQKFNFSDFKISPTEIFRATIIGTKDDERFVITAGLDNHTNVLRAAILNLLGYDVTIPKYYKSLTIKFRSNKTKDLFLKKLGEQTLTKRTRWIEQNNDFELILKDVTIEPARLKNVNIFLPVMTRERQKERRVFRSLLSVYSLTDFPQSINAVEWKVGRLFNDYLIVNHPYASQFRNVTIADLKWIQNRINKLTRNEIKSAVNLAKYPEGVNHLVLEKLLERINSLNEHLKLKHRFITKKEINSTNIKDGKLISNQYHNRVVEYYKASAESPYNYRDLFRLFRTQTTYNALSKVLEEAVEKFVPGLKVGDAIESLQDKISDYRIDNAREDGSIPVKVFSYPTAFVNAGANRNIVFGQHMDSNAPIQLVDTIYAAANLGLYNMFSGVSTDVTPSISAGVSINRSYTHVRGMPDLNSATQQSIKKILVPKVLKSVGKIIKTEFTCSLENDVNVVETILRGEPVIYIKYDKNISTSRESAIAKRIELIKSGADEDIILLVPIDRLKFCSDEVDEEKEKNLETFLREFALDEIFIINDSIDLTSNINLAVPLDAGVAGASLIANVGGDISKGLLKSVIIKKKEETIEVSIQEQQNHGKQFNLGLSLFIKIVNNSTRWFTGEMQTKLYSIPTKNLTPSERTQSLNALRELFVSNSTHYLKEYYNPMLLDHDVHGRINTFKFLWFKNQSVRMDHEIDIELPEQGNLSLEERTKTLFSTRSVRRDGKDYFGLFNSIVNRISNFISLGSEEVDSAKTIKGSSKTRYYVSEGDITERSSSAITTKVDYIWSGWSSNTKKLNSIFDFIEGLFEETQTNYSIDRNQFKNMSLLRNYEVRTTFIVYPEFLEKFNTLIINAKKINALNILRELYGTRKWERYCARRNRMSKRTRTNTRKSCIPGPVKRLLEAQITGEDFSQKALIKHQNKVITTLLEGFNRKKVLNWIGKENFFSSTRVTGFMEDDEKGFINYISNSYGQYNTEHGTGIFDSIATLLNISPYEFRALNYTPGI